MDERERLRAECHDLVNALRASDLPEAAFRLLEKLVERLDRIETGSFPPSEVPTKPEPRKSSGQVPAAKGWKADAVLSELEKGREPPSER